jgi:hypothetical protein
MPVEVVLDQADVLAVYIREGSPFTFPDEWPWGSAHPWSARGRWEGHGALVLHRPDDAYTVWAFWEGAERAFEGWYVNFQRPIERGATTLDTLDHEVDIWIPREGRWEFKDLDLLRDCVRLGRVTAEEAKAIRCNAERVAGLLDAGWRWWPPEWEAWRSGDLPPERPTLPV